jgi:hypothetical protein
MRAFAPRSSSMSPAIIRSRPVGTLISAVPFPRSELAALECGHIQQRDGRWVFVDLVGKGKEDPAALCKGRDRRLDGRGRFIGGLVGSSAGAVARRFLLAESGPCE